LFRKDTISSNEENVEEVDEGFQMAQYGYELMDVDTEYHMR